MQKITTVEEGVKRLCELKQEPCPDFTITEDERYKRVTFGGETVPLFIGRENPKIQLIKRLPVLGEPCALTVYAADAMTVEALLIRETDIAEYLLCSTVSRMRIYRQNSTAIALIGMENGTTANVIVHSAYFGNRQFKHELFTTEGMASDRAVDTVVAQSALNVFTPEGDSTYTDTDRYLYGLTQAQLDEAYCVYNTLTADKDEIRDRAERLDRIITAALGEEARI